jgi:two-component system, OmpR family, sensor kinase
MRRGRLSVLRRLLRRFRVRELRDLRALDASSRLGHPPRPLPLAAAIFVLVALLGLTTFSLGRDDQPAILLIVAAAAVFGIAVAVGWALAAADYRSAQQADRAGAELLAMHVELDRERRETSSRLHDARALTAAIGAALHALQQSGPDPAIIAALSDQLAALRHSLTEQHLGRLEPIEVSQVLLEVSSFATLHGIALIHEAADSAVVLANRDHLVAILQNLIDNARKYAPGSPILITCEPAGPYLKLVIQDEGPGIAAAAAEDLFLPGVRRGDDAQGYGMGLAISRRLAERMGGAIWYESHSGRGARFILKLPRADSLPTSSPGEPL